MKHLKFKTSNLNRFFKSIFFVAALLLTFSTFSQTVTVDDTKTTEQLANQLIDNSCINLSNVDISSSKSVATFNNNGGDFPINKGIIIRTGKAKDTEGPFTDTKLSSEISLSGDSDLQDISDNDGGNKNIIDVGSLEFNFTPVSKNFSFNYIFASNEYGVFQCDSRDLFAIILTNLETGISNNIATITDIKQNVSVKNIRDINNNGFCPSVNAELFSTYYVDNSNNSTINMRGFTKTLKAEASVVPNNKYKIKFVIADYDNSGFDSAVFIEAGSFNNSLDLEADKELCNGDDVIIDSGFYETDGFKFEWTKNGTPLTDNGTKITVNTIGTYALTITSSTAPSCQLTDKIEITSLKATTPDDIDICTEDTTLNIPDKVQSQILNGAPLSNYTIDYFESIDDANNSRNPITNPTNYPITTNAFTLWARLSITDKECFDIVSFNVSITSPPLVDQLPDAYACNEYALPNLIHGEYFTKSGGIGDKLAVGKKITTESTIYIYNKNETTGCSSQTSFKVYFAENYNIATDHCESFTIPETPLGKFYTKENGTGELLPTGEILTEDTTIYFYSEFNGEACVNKQFEIVLNTIPPVDDIDDIITCESYVLDPLPSGGAYYTGYNGTGTKYSPGDLIESTIRLFIYNKDEATGCTSGGLLSNRLYVTIIKRSEFPDIIECGSYTIPTTSIGKYYTDNTYGTIIPSGTPITSTQKIYYYANEITTTPNCTGYEISVTINPLPKVDDIDDIVSCEDDLPKLPSLENGSYYTKSGGPDAPGQILLSEGDEINSSQKIYIYKTNTICTVETDFNVIINKKPIIPDFPDVKKCDPFELPILSFSGRYFTESGGPNGTGTEMFPGDFIEEGTQTIFIYSEHPDLETCTNEKSFEVTILVKVVDELDDVILACDFFELPVLANGNYYKNIDKTEPLTAGDIINSNQTIYIIGENSIRYEPCQSISSFEVNIFAKPNLEDLGVINDINQCSFATLPSITAPEIIVEYYSDLNRTTLITPSEYTITNNSSEIITNTIYVRAYSIGYPGCFADGTFLVTLYPLLNIEAKGGTICVDYDTNETNNPFLIETGIDSSAYDIKWYLNGDLFDNSSAEWEADKVGTYRIEATRKIDINNPNSSTDCNYRPTEVVIESSTPKFEVNILSENFSSSYEIEINTIEQGLGNYTYSLNGTDFSTNNIFRNISRGSYIVTIRDLDNICNDIELEFTALNNPVYFNPDEGDYWNITDLKDDPTATIDIFDRFGILIKTIKPSGPGWNGLSSNGNRMPSTDYWYVLKYTNTDGDPAIFRSHFSLIRK
ncbi:choice-of-anchor L domain-containing protein [Polaribacter sp. R2A056_3_33]|uniref:choice-of-anchor L domain-containing protein n=1 Tax=Polaribacter sp. R2A056_3_33 TaxID=2745563 RepID=UPI001C502565|nr:choice-of-anchor L domain-containing protein [Polaribacter sp. R2A056_3_33]QXP69896.1 choice-of-anchor L domain-containing protein [Polaribacter sp. R2A056_3_33]